MKRTFVINGMKCVHCKSNVENAIKTLPAVASVEADLDGKTVTVEYDDTTLSAEQIKETVETAGNYEIIL